MPKRTLLQRREIPSLPVAERGMRSVPAWTLSLLLHICIIVTVGSLWVASPKGTGGERERPIGVAIVYESSGGEEYYLGESAGANANANDVASSLQDALPNATAMTSDGLLSDLLPGPSSGPGDPSSAAGGIGLGDGGAALGTNRSIPKVKTTVFGIEGEGTRFLYVFDRSDSMNGYRGVPLRSAKLELRKSLQSLGPTHQFQIIFYNDSPLPYGGLGGRGPKMLKGDQRTKDAAERFVRNLVAVGGTRHIDALRMALAMGPDVIFFLTDADHPAPPLRDIENLHTRAARGGTTIHTIQFGAGSNAGGGGWIKLLASGTSGQYRYIDVTQLGEDNTLNSP